MMYYEELQKDFQGFLDYRKASGYSTDNYKRILTEFICFSEDIFPNAENVTKAMIDRVNREGRMCPKYTGRICFCIPCLYKISLLSWKDGLCSR